MSDLKVTVNEPFDANRIRMLYALPDDLRLANPQATIPFIASEWDQYFPLRGPHTSLLFWKKEQIIGHAGLLVRQDQLYLCFLILAREYRGQGLGQWMLKEAEEFSRLNYTHRELQLHVYRYNLHAKALYTKAGYKLVAEDHEKFRMKKDLW